MRLAGNLLRKAGELIDEDAPLVVEGAGHVGRGAFKLEHALEVFRLDPKGKLVIDIGASTGGFTEILLGRGAREVHAVDVGTGQLAAQLRGDARVINREGTHILHVTAPPLFEAAVMDLSFISIGKIINHVRTLLSADAWLVALVKPQFEAGPQRLPKDGVLKDAKLREEILQEVLATIQGAGFKVVAVTDSPIAGKSGNHEYLAHLACC